MNKLRIGVVGAGHLGRFHARLLRQIEQVELVGIADPVDASRHLVAEECNVPGFADYRELIDQIDAAVIATPTVLHHAVSIELLKAGKHLLIEKPIAATTAQAEEMVALANQQGLTLQVGHIERFNPALNAVRPYLSEPKYIEAARLSGYTFRSTDIGVVLDLMIHDIDLVLSLTSSTVRHVDALGISIMGGHEDIAQARLTLENGCVVNLSASRMSYLPQRTMQVWSKTGFASVDFTSRESTVVRPSEKLVQQFGVDLAATLPQEEKQRLKDHVFDELLPTVQQQPAANNALLEELNDFVQSVLTGKAPQVTGEHGLHALSVAERILAEVQTHCWDGREDGPIGPHWQTMPQILRGPHWQHKSSVHQVKWQREAS